MGPPPTQILVRLERSGAQAGEVYSDGEGKFSFNDVPPNLYRIIVRQAGYRPVDVGVPINSSVQHSVYLQIELTPEEKPGSASLHHQWRQSSHCGSGCPYGQIPQGGKEAV